MEGAERHLVAAHHRMRIMTLSYTMPFGIDRIGMLRRTAHRCRSSAPAGRLREVEPLPREVLNFLNFASQTGRAA